MTRSGAGALALALVASPLSAAEAPLEAGTSGAVLDVPFLPQEPALCGGAAAAMVLRYWGVRDVDSSTFASLVDEESGDIRVVDLTADLEARGWHVATFGADWAEVTRHLSRGRPLIALIEPAAGGGHYVVITGAAPDRVLVHDPALGPHRPMSRAEMDAAWAPTDRLALLVLPGESRVSATPGPRAGEADAPPGTPVTPAREDDHLSPHAARLVASARALAGAERYDAAADTLAAAMSESPAAHTPVREMAALRFRERRWPEAATLAARAVALAPHDEHAVRILATSRYLAGDERGALAAWNRVDEPHVDLVDTPGLAGVRYDVVAHRVALSPGDLLTPARFARAERRLAALPAAARTSLRYRPSGARASVDAVVVRRSPLALRPGLLLRGAVRAFTDEEVVLQTPGPAERGELITLRARWPAPRGRVAASVATPDPLGVPGVLTLDARWEEESFSSPVARRETRRRGAATLGDWLNGNTHVAITLGVERWSVRVGDVGGTDTSLVRHWTSRHLVTGATVGRRLAADHVAVGVAADVRIALEGSSTHISSWSMGGAWRSTRDELHPALHARVGASGVASGRLHMLRPGAGVGVARAPLLRAHPLLEDDVVTGAFIGTHLVHGTLEGLAYPLRVGPVYLGAALFADGAFVHAPEDGGAVAIDVGGGLRLRLPGVPGLLRVDAATDLRSSASALSAAWSGGWGAGTSSGGR